MKVVLAPDKFKGCLTSAEVAEAVGEGLRTVCPEVDLTVVPIADGGDGTVDAAVSAGFDRVQLAAVGPTGEPVHTSYAADGTQAVIELAAVVGLDRLPDRALRPLVASSYGLGLVLAHAVDRGADRVVLGLGGSASTDGGAGMAQALGARLLDSSGAELPRGGAALAQLDAVDLSALRELRAEVTFVVASDVDNPLLGGRGAAATFGPQKGATPAEVRLLDRALRRWAEVVESATATRCADAPGAGAAGGVGFAAMALLGAALVPGIDVMLDLVGFRHALRGADLVITGEGSLDEQSLAGKAPVGVARAARAGGVPVVAVAGRSLLTSEQLLSAGIEATYPLADLEPDVSRSMANAAELLRQVGVRIAGEWLR
jgi:glycerate kinase